METRQLLVVGEGYGLKVDFLNIRSEIATDEAQKSNLVQSTGGRRIAENLIVEFRNNLKKGRIGAEMDIILAKVRQNPISSAKDLTGWLY